MFTVFYVLGLLKSAVFIDLAQIDRSSARGLNYVLLSIKLIYLSFFFNCFGIWVCLEVALSVIINQTLTVLTHTQVIHS